MRPHAPKTRARRAGNLTPHAPRARLSDHDMAIAVAHHAKVPASVTAASVVMAPVRGHDMAIAAKDRGSVTVAAGASVAVDVDRVGARSARSVSIT